MKPSIEQATPEYLELFAACRIAQRRLLEVDNLIAQIETHADRYQTVSARTGVPWFVIGLLHNLECGLSFLGHLHNGDNIRRPTVNDPAGRPPHWSGVGTWEDSAVDAVQYDRLDEFKNWDVARCCYEFEQFNGWGYRGHGIHSPYLWAGSQHYTAGKYIRDHIFDPAAVSDQIGTAVLLFRMCERNLVALEARPAGENPAA